MNELVLICEGCGKQALDGYISVRYADIHAYSAAERAWQAGHPGDVHSLEDFKSAPEEIRWRPYHYDCDPKRDQDAYQIGAGTLRTWADLSRWSAHLMAKNWLPCTDWDDVLRECADGTGTRISVRLAAA